MYRRSDKQGSLFQVDNLISDEKRRRMERDWPGQFKLHALPLINEDHFRDLYCADNGRPNKPVRMVVGVLILKDMFDLTDDDALACVDYDLRWQMALCLAPEDAHACQKTLHNFRSKLLGNDKARQLFAEMTDKMMKLLGLDVERQRLDSTHIISNIAMLTRLGLFCETMRLFLRDLKKSVPEKYNNVSEALRRRYVKDDGEDTRYQDAKSTETQRRLNVCARDVYRLVKMFEQDDSVKPQNSFGILTRLFSEQCEISADAEPPAQDDADVLEPVVPVAVKDKSKVSSASLQSPHDVDLTYSGHKGKGAEVQLAETVGNGDKPELITHVALTRSCDSDVEALIPALDDLAGRGLQPQEMTVDTTYASAANVIECEKQGTEIVAPVRGPAAESPVENEKTLADFKVIIKDKDAPVVCPAGHSSESVLRKESGKLVALYSSIHCKDCPFQKSCPTTPNPDGSRTLKTTLEDHTLARRRAYERTAEFRKRYAIRAGIEGTNSELKRAHGLGRLRVRGGARVKLSVYFKVLSCNVKRMVKYLAEMAGKAV